MLFRRLALNRGGYTTGCGSSRLIMPINNYIGHDTRNSRDSEAMDSKETPVHPVHEERWRPSQGIRFHSPSSDKSWRPSQGIVFSKIDEGQRAPFPMETRVSREPRINSILTEDPLSPTSTPSDLHVPRGRSSSVLPGNEPLFGPDSIHMVDCSRESDKVLEQAFSVWGSECVDEPRNGSIRAEKPSKAEINPSSPILRSSLERALINHQVNIQSHRNNTNLQPPQIKVELHSTLERAKNNYREILSRFDALIREPSISPPYLIRLQDMRDKVEIMKEEMTLCIHRMRDILRILCQIRQLTSMEPYEQVIYRRNTSRLNYLLHNIEVIRKHKLSRGSPYKLAFWQLSAFEKRRNNKLGRWRKLFGLCTKHMPTFIARKGRNPAFVSATKFRSLMLMKERFCNTHFTLFESWRNLAQPLVEFLNMKRIRLAPWHYTQSSWDKLEAAIENGPSRKINTPSKGDLTASRYDSLVSPKSVVKTRHSKTIKTLFIYQKTPHFKILRFRSLLGVHNGREAKFSSHSPPVPLMILHSHLSLSPTKSLRHPSVPESCCGPCPRLSIPEYYDGLSPELCHLVPGVAPRITFAEETVFSPLGFHIPRATLQEIEHASLKHKKTFWQYTLYRGPSQEKVQLHYCKCKESSELTAQLFLDEDIIGFDIEWKAQASAKDGIRKNVALIQLASEDRIALFHIARYSKGDTLEDLVAPTLQKIMESPKITKVGVAIKADCTRLRRYMSIDSRGLFELSHLYKVVRYSAGDVKKINKTTVSLAQQVEEHLELPLWKGDVRSSDWSEELNSEQIRYAASDSYAGFHLYHALERKRKALSPVPPRPSHAELNLPIRLATDENIATDNALSEVADEVSIPPASNSPDSTEEILRDFLNFALKDPMAPTPILKLPKDMPTKPSTSTPRPEFSAANEWVARWRTTLSSNYKPRALPAQLRAYALWHDQQQEVTSAASILRDPPLKLATVAVYIMEALKLERLPFEPDRIIDVVQCLPTSCRLRYGSFLRQKGIQSP